MHKPFEQPKSGLATGDSDVLGAEPRPCHRPAAHRVARVCQLRYTAYMNNLLSPKRRVYDIILFAAALISLLIASLLSEYRYKPSVSADYRARINLRMDSLAAAYGIDRDTAGTFAQLSVDNTLIDVLVDSLGVLQTRHYLQAHQLQELRYDVSIGSPSRSNNINLSFSSNSRPRDNAHSSSDVAVLRANFDNTGRLVGLATQHKTEPPTGSAEEDSTRLFQKLIAAVPASYKAQQRHWTTERHDLRGSTVYTTVLDSTAVWTKRLHIAAQRSEPEATTWNASWLEFVETNTDPHDKHSAVHTKFIGTLQTSFLILSFTLVITMTGAFVSRLRKKAVSIVFCIVSTAIVASYFFINSFIFIEMPVLASFIVIFMFAIIGFLFVGMPIAGTFSLIRERYAERFYTLLRLRREPWNSHYTGRSLLIGIAIALITSAATVLTYSIADKSGTLDIFGSNLFFHPGFYFLSVQPATGILITILFIALISLLFITITPALTARIPSARLRMGLSVAGAFLFTMLFPMIQSSEIAEGLISAIFSGLVGIILFYTVDVLAVAVFATASAALGLLPILQLHPMLGGMLSVIALAVVGLGVKAYISPVETVHEEDYKPLFVYQLEEEKRILQELAAAQSVQKRLLPTVLPQIDNIRVAASCIPALEVGGDYYDFFRLDDHRLGVLIGDVSGKGMSAAFYITLAKGVIVSQIHQAGSPADVLKGVNSLVYGVLERGKFISLIYGILDTRTREFIYANAGHNPPLHRRADTPHSTEFIRTKGMAIGLDNGKVFNQVMKNHSLVLNEGDILLLYTDGVTEALDYNGNEYGDERMQATVAASPSGADSVVSTLVSTVMNFIGKAKQHDDITVVAVEIIPSSPQYQALPS